MPKLSPKVAKKVDSQEGSSFEAVPPGRYLLQLRAVTVEQGPKGPYWKWEFKIPAEEEFAGRKFWLNTSLSEDALWKMKEVFTAFGYTPDTDTDEILGENIYAQIGQRTIQAGQRQGEIGNEIIRLIPNDDADPVDEEEDEDEPEPAPAPKRSTAKKATTTRKAATPPPDENEDEDEEAEEEDDEEEDEDPAPRPRSAKPAARPRR